ncbi:MAG: hypothetical protein U5N86_07350 [Planctomycetota bacterium]|nr:hypothetical protein [Planctomycetota bacterium]
MADIVYSDYGSLRPDKLEEDILRDVVLARTARVEGEGEGGLRNNGAVPFGL